jgi:uncharacterized protein involved in outer membrane biogenesis
MALRSRILLIALGIAATLLVAASLGVAALLNLDRYKPRVISYLQERTGQQIEIGRLNVTLFPVSIHIDNFGVKNPPGFPPGYLVTVERIDVELDSTALRHRQMVIKSLVLDKPVLNLISDPDGGWNFENPQAKTSEQGFSLGAIGTVQIKQGELVASNLLPSDAPGPVVFEAHGMSGEFEQVTLDAILNRASNSMGGQGDVKADRLEFGAVSARNLKFKLQLWARQVFLADARAEVYGGRAAGALFFDLSKKRPVFRTTARFSGVSLVPLLEPFENGRGKMTGNMEGDLTLAGEIQHSHRPLAGIYGKGHVTVRNGEVPSLRLNENLMKLVRFNNQGPAKDDPSSFNLISTDLELANLRIVSKVIDIDGYGVDVDGSGSVNVDGSNELNYQGEAKITTNQGFFTKLFARLSGAKVEKGQLSFPFRVRGTIDGPVFTRGKGN